jgi:transglutaminase-like putative cysteine protease
MSGSAANAAVPVERFFEFAVLGLIASGYLAVLGSGYLDPATAILAAAGILLRALVTTGVVRLHLSARLVTVVTLAYIGFYPLDYLYVSRQFLAATVHLVFFLAVVKVLSAKTARDYLYLIAVAFMELLAAAILSTSLNFFLFLALFLVFAVAALASAEICRSMRKPGVLARAKVRRFYLRISALAVAAALGILTLTGGMFFLLPRTARAAFQHLIPGQYHLPGFSNEVALGQIGTILQQNNAVMHVQFFKNDRIHYLKWRGVALSQFDGRRWFNPVEGGVPLRPEHGRVTLGRNFARWQSGYPAEWYEVQLSAVFSDALFFAGSPEVLQVDAPLVIRTATDSYRVGYGGSDGLRYLAYSFLDEEGTPDLADIQPLAPAERAAYLETPALDPRIGSLARSVTAGRDSDRQRAVAIEGYLRRSYGYTIQLPAARPADPLADFLFTRKKGHCEYFASAMAVMLRTVGIPSRVVNGFQSGVWNPISGWYMIRASDAHSWVEVWLPRSGWTTFDPTPRAANPAAPTVWSKLDLYLDAGDTFWREWVLAYDKDRQLTLATGIKDSSRVAGARWLDKIRLTALWWKDSGAAWLKDYGATVLALLVAGLCAGLFGRRAVAWMRTRERVHRVECGLASSSDATLLYLRMLAVLKKSGFDKPPWLTPLEFARVLPASETAAMVRRLTAAYNDLRFGAKPGAAPRILELLEKLEQSQTPPAKRVA